MTFKETLSQFEALGNEKMRVQQAITIGEKLGIYRDYPVSKGCTSPFAPSGQRHWLADKADDIIRLKTVKLKYEFMFSCVYQKLVLKILKLN